MAYGRGAPARGTGGFNRGGRGGYQQSYDSAPAELVHLGHFVHASEGDMVCRCTNDKVVPYFNAPIFSSSNAKTPIGKVDEILGPINEVYFTVKVAEGVVAASFKAEDKVLIGNDKLLPLERFLPRPAVPKIKKGKTSGTSRGGRGGRGGIRGSSSRGGSFRGGFSSRGGASRGGFSSRGGSRGGFSRGGSSRGGRGGY